MTQMDGCEEIKMNNCMKQQMAEAEAEKHMQNKKTKEKKKGAKEEEGEIGDVGRMKG